MRQRICKDMIMVYCYPFFRGKFLISDADEELIKNERTESLRAHALLDTIIRKDPQRAYEALHDFLTNETIQTHLATGLRKTLMEQQELLEAHGENRPKPDDYSPAEIIRKDDEKKESVLQNGNVPPKRAQNVINSMSKS